MGSCTRRPDLRTDHLPLPALTSMTSVLPETPHILDIQHILNIRKKWIARSSVRHQLKAMEILSEFRARHLDFSGPEVVIGNPSTCTAAEQKEIEARLRTFMPWRKGPFSVFGIHIDAEWQSNRKWDRLLPEIPDLQNKEILDVGCNNGYYMFRMAHHEPRYVLGIDPTVPTHLAFSALNGMARVPQLHHELLGVEHVHLFPECFDVIFLMGILYHHPSPLGILKQVTGALKPGGVLLLETQGIPGNEPVALFPVKRYARVPGTYFVPTASCLENLMKRAGLKGVKIFDSHAMSNEEQRKTDWMVYQSYSDFLDPDDATRTVEGYPAPIRIYARANR